MQKGFASPKFITEAGFAPILIIFLFAIAALGGGYLVYTTKNSNPPNPSPTPKVSTSPEKVVEDFYSQYLDCLKDHFRKLTGKSPREDCPFNSNQALNKALIQRLEQKKGSDPILCAQNLPINISVDKALVNDNKASTLVHTLFGSSVDNQIIVGLNDENGSWKIADITCTHNLQDR